MSKEVKQDKYNNFNLTIEDLKKRPLSYSSLKEFLKSPRHFVDYRTKERSKQTEAMLLGSLVHLLILEPEKVAKNVIKLEKIDRRTKEGKKRGEEIDALRILEPNKLFVSVEMFEKAQLMKNSFFNNEFAKELFDNKTSVEESMNFENRETKLSLIAKIDMKSSIDKTKYIVDLKTAKSSQPSEFAKSLINFKYDLQAPLYINPDKLKFKEPKFLFIIIENESPFNCEVLEVSNSDMNMFYNSYLNVLANFQRCMFEDSFNKGYEFFNEKETNFLKLPSWYKKY